MIWTFIGITGVLYGLVFLTPGSNTPKLGIDLQGGTRITLTARTQDGSDPTRQQMQQARSIMESRVNGSGVAGAEIQIDGARQLVITVPGTQDLNSLTRTAQMNIRPVVSDASGNPVISYPAGYVPPAASSTPPSSGSGASASATTVPAIGDSPTPTASAVPGESATVAPGSGSQAATTAPASSPAPGLRGPQAAVAAPSGGSAASSPPAASTPAPSTPAASTPAGSTSRASRNASRMRRFQAFRTTALPTLRETLSPSRG